MPVHMLVLLISQERIFQKYFGASFTTQVSFLFYKKNSMSYEGFDLEKFLKRDEFHVSFGKKF